MKNKKEIERAMAILKQQSVTFCMWLKENNYQLFAMEQRDVEAAHEIYSRDETFLKKQQDRKNIN